MINVVYLVIFVLGGTNGGSMTSQAIPQANMAQCQANAKPYNTGWNKSPIVNGMSDRSPTMAAHCIIGVAVK